MVKNTKNSQITKFYSVAQKVDRDARYFIVSQDPATTSQTHTPDEEGANREITSWNMLDQPVLKN